MKYLKVYLKLFLIMAIAVSLFALVPFILLGTLKAITLRSNWFNEASMVIKQRGFEVVFLGFWAGIVASLTGGTMQIRSANRIPTHHSDNLSTVQQRDLQLNTEQAKAFSKCMSSLVLLKAKVTQQNPTTGSIKANAPTSFDSRGNEIEFSLSPVTPGATHIKIVSRPRVRLALVDYGSNLENVEKIVGFLEKEEQPAIA